jgi:lysophospholipase L1-like esterase
MHSSISSSEDVRLKAPPVVTERAESARTGIIVLLVGLAVIMLGFELGSPLLLDHLSRTEHRVEGELSAARALRPVTADGRPTVLLTGNSLLLEGVKLDQLHDNLASQFEVSRLGIEQTHYLDWYFGLRRLLQEGSRPNLIVLSLATDQLASKFTLGEEFAHRQMSVQDFPRAIRETKLDRTTASTYFFAHFSNWLADKGVIRQRVLILLVPNFRGLAARIADHTPHVNDPAALEGMTRQRLPELRDLAQQYGVKIVLLVPPTLHEDDSRPIQQIGAEVGVPVWVLSPPGEFPRNLYRDGFHLNDQGSEIFTSRLAEQIRKMGSESLNLQEQKDTPR